MALNNLFIDFNSYFASVEQQVKPELRNKPVGVVPVLADTTCCIAASYEAKARGVKTGTMVSEAKKLCPGIHLVQANHRTYIEYHNKLVKKVEECIPVDQVLSIDEMVCSLYGNEQKRENAVKIALTIKQKIREDVGESLCCSIGIAPNQFLAKTGTNLQKPDGLVVIDNEDLPNILHKLDLSDLTGVGRRMLIRLHKNNIYSMKNLCDADKDTLRNIWGGIEGDRMYDQLRGKFIKRPPTHRGTVGHSHVLPPKLKNNISAYAVLDRLLQKAAMRLRHLGYYAGAVGVSVRYKVNLSVSNSKINSKDQFHLSNKRKGSSFPGYDNFIYNAESNNPNYKNVKWKDYTSFTLTQNTTEFLKALNILWKRNPYTKEYEKHIPTAVGVILFNLSHENFSTLQIFENFEKNKSLYNSIDLLNKRYGYASIYFAGSHTARNSAPMRIAFTQIPNLEIEDDKKIF